MGRDVACYFKAGKHWSRLRVHQFFRYYLDDHYLMVPMFERIKEKGGREEKWVDMAQVRCFAPRSPVDCPRLTSASRAPAEPRQVRCSVPNVLLERGDQAVGSASSRYCGHAGCVGDPRRRAGAASEGGR